MKILVFQPDVSRIGGSIATILTFAECFKELGHEVKVLSSWQDKFERSLVKTKEDLIPFYGFKNLTLNDFDFSWNFNRIKVSTHFEKCDIMFTRGFTTNPHMKKPSIVWTILPRELPHTLKIGNLKQVWTNSKTSYDDLGYPDARIVVPPHDYLYFRKQAKDFDKRKYDVVSVLRANEYHAKGIDIFEKVAKSGKYKCLLITTINGKETEKQVKSLGVPYVANISRRECAEILGDSRVVFHPSRAESCPLVIYEGLNAGCNIVTRNVGAVKEQLGGFGRVFEKDTDPYMKLIDKALREKNVTDRIFQGATFDKTTWIGRIERILHELS